MSRPEQTHKVKPDYPEEARVERAEGIAVLDAIIRKDGTVSDACVVFVRPQGVGFDRAAIEAVKQWRYKPALREGAPVNTIFTIKIEWSFGGR